MLNVKISFLHLKMLHQMLYTRMTRLQGHLRLLVNQLHTNQTGDILISTDHDGIRRILLNNPKQRNILSMAVLAKLKQSLLNGMEDGVPPVHCVIIGATGSTFSAGHDLKELISENKANHLALFELCAQVMQTIGSLPVPVIAEVKGHAAAAGCQLAAACDIVVASESAKFSTPGINVGLFCSTPGVALVRAVPRKVASYMLFTGMPITARDAAQYGLVSKLVPDDKLEDETMIIARAIRDKSKLVQTLGKDFLQKQLALPLSEAYRVGAKVMVENLTYQDTQDGIDAFSKKQVPTWTHSNKKSH